MPSWIDAVIVATLVTTVIYLVYRNFRIRVLFKTLSDMHLQVLGDKILLEQKVKDMYQEIENIKLQQSDGFVKFLSDSRDWAFDYIEKTQETLSDFDKIISEIFEWSETYGTAIGDNPHANKIKEISLAYEQLKQVLPKDNQTPNN